MRLRAGGVTAAAVLVVGIVGGVLGGALVSGGGAAPAPATPSVVVEHIADEPTATPADEPEAVEAPLVEVAPTVVTVVRHAPTDPEIAERAEEAARRADQAADRAADSAEEAQDAADRSAATTEAPAPAPKPVVTPKPEPQDPRCPAGSRWNTGQLGDESPKCIKDAEPETSSAKPISSAPKPPPASGSSGPDEANAPVDPPAADDAGVGSDS